MLLTPIVVMDKSTPLLLRVFFFFGLFVFCLSLFVCLPFKAESVAYGSSQARGHIRAIAAAVGRRDSHSNTGSEHHLQLPCSLWPCQILNLLSEARDRTCILMDTSWVLNPLSHNRNSTASVFKKKKKKVCAFWKEQSFGDGVVR